MYYFLPRGQRTLFFCCTHLPSSVYFHPTYLDVTSVVIAHLAVPSVVFTGLTVLLVVCTFLAVASIVFEFLFVSPVNYLQYIMLDTEAYILQITFRTNMYVAVFQHYKTQAVTSSLLLLLL